MDIDWLHDEGIELFFQIIVEEEFIKTGVENKSEDEMQRLEIKCDNIIAIALGKDYSEMIYMIDNEKELTASSPERQKAIFETTSKTKVEIIKVLKNYIATKDIRLLQDYWDSLIKT